MNSDGNGQNNETKNNFQNEEKSINHKMITKTLMMNLNQSTNSSVERCNTSFRMKL